MIYFNKRIYSYVIIFVSLLLVDCSETPTVGGSETTNTLNFKVVYPTGEVASGATVKLRPSDYNASIDTDMKEDGSIQNLKTDDQGRVEIGLMESGDFVIEMNDNSSYASMLKFSTYSSTGDTTLNDQILKPYAIVSGIIDSSVNSTENIFVNINGIDRSTVVDDAGSFTFDDLPEGDYTLEAVSSNNDISIILENVSAISNSETELIISSDGYRYQTSVTINATATGADITEDLYDFPLLVRLDSSTIGSTPQQPYVEDLEIINANGQLLAYDIESWDGSIQEAILWVLVDTITAQENTTLTMSWKTTSEVASLKQSTVFDNETGYSGVWHFESSETIDDETSDRKGTNAGCTSSNGVIANAMHFSDSSTVTLPAENLAGLTDAVTISFWQYGTESDTVEKHCVFDTQSTDSSKTHILAVHMPWILNGVNQASFNAGIDTTFHNLIKSNVEPEQFQGAWNHWSFTNDAVTGNVKIFYNGEVVENGAGRYGTFEDIGQFQLGANFVEGLDNINNYNGSLDEFRVSHVVRSTSWIKMSYANQKIGSDIIKFVEMD